jgi:hypothetical protein
MLNNEAVLTKEAVRADAGVVDWWCLTLATDSQSGATSQAAAHAAAAAQQATSVACFMSSFCVCGHCRARYCLCTAGSAASTVLQ